MATFLGANAGGAQQEANQVSGSLNSAASAANSAASGAAQNIWSQAAGGTNTGSFNGTPQYTTSTTTGPTQTTWTAAPSSSSGEDSGWTTLPGAGSFSASTSAPTTVTSTPSPYDFSKVNLAQYSGPTAQQATQSLAAAQNASASAVSAAKAAQTAPEENAWDSALLTQSPAYQQVSQAVGNAQQAAANGNALVNSGQEAVNQAQNTSQANIAAQRQGLTQAGATLSSQAATNAAAATKAYSDLSAASTASGIGDLQNALSSDADALEAAGLSPAQLQQLESGLADGSIDRTAAYQNLAPFLAVLQNAPNGETTLGAAETNSVNSLLNNGAPTISAQATGSLGTMQNTASDAAGYVRDLGGYSGSDPNTVKEISSALATMLSAGQTPQQIASSMQLNPNGTEAKLLSQLNTPQQIQQFIQNINSEWGNWATDYDNPTGQVTDGSGHALVPSGVEQQIENNPLRLGAL